MTKADADFGTRWFEKVWNQKRRESISEMMAADTPIHEGGATTYGPEGFYSFFDRMHAAFSDLRVSIQDTLVQDDKVCVRWSCTMKHTGGGLGMAPTGKTLETTGISIIRVVGGKAVECWQNWDMLGVMQQIQQAAGAPTYIASSV